uniref:DNA-directed DNA polymerase n=1 Tax=Rhizophagus fasciculatus TaxID=47032 RepID=A0A0U1YXY0_9GLOM|nr:plasmid related DNA polymerase [Rhizophagus fasciculatus]AJK91319.1 plasmid related DNA polymerase [Rhizophagus fasciculatus]
MEAQIKATSTSNGNSNNNSNGGGSTSAPTSVTPLITNGNVIKTKNGVKTQLNDMKITAQQNKQATIRNLAKLLMNSMYGRFGMHPTLTSNHIWTQQQIKGITKAWMIENRIPLGEFELVTTILNKEWILETQGEKGLRKQLENLGNKTNVAIAAAVTAHSRIIINQFKLEALALGLDLYYSDTDSLVLSGELPSEMIDSATLGKLKLEHKIKEGHSYPTYFFLKILTYVYVTPLSRPLSPTGPRFLLI